MFAPPIESARLSASDARRIFRTLLDALANPGRPEALDIREPLEGVPPVVHAVLALADLDVTFTVLTGHGEPAGSTMTELITRSTGARLATNVAVAEFVVALDSPTAADVLSLRRGTAHAPEAGAQLFVGCARVATVDEPMPRGLRVQCRGPGAAGGRTFAVEGAGREMFEALRAVNDDFPAGVDTWLIDADAAVVGLPRSGRLVLDGPAA